MNNKQKEAQKIRRLVAGGLRETIRAHGPITTLLIGSATKRIVGMLSARQKRDQK